MKRKYILVTALMMLIFLTGIAAAVPPVSPPAPQNLGLGDTEFYNVTVSTCKNCHPDPVNIHHAMVGGNANYGTPLGCPDCHPMTGPLGSQTMTISRNCHDCHDGTAWTANPVVNLSVLRGSPGRPHHNTTKASVWNYAIDATHWAADRQCKNCHGSLIANYNDGHLIPAYNASLVTPMADFKLNSTTGKGREYGGCAVCHDTGVDNGITLNSNHDTHHTVKFWVGNQCNNCHVSSGYRAEPVPDYNPEPSANFYRVWYNQSYTQYLRYGWDTSVQHFELRNSTMLNAGDTINGTGCQKCHGMDSLHNIEFNAAYNQANKIPGQGHNGNDSDCDGCHYGNSLFLSYGAITLGASSIGIDSVTPGTINANTATDVTIAGTNLAQDGYDTQVLIDGTPVNGSVTDTSIVVSVTLAAGGHSVQVTKTNSTVPTDTTSSAVTSLSAIASPTITSAELASGVLAITGSGFGTSDMTSVTITKADGTQVLAATTSWSDTQITANGTDAAAGDSVTVLTKTGSATATITAAPTPTPTPTLTTITVSPSSATMRVHDTQVFTATATDQNGNPMSGITITWSSSDTRVGTVNPTSATTDSNGQATTTFTAAHPGDAIVSASSGSVSGSANVHV
jgi:hypothetical protein